ncbi:MAG: CoB--CoM heterodisulfide reductase iron-sulfur subunit A family protein [Candidatus Krumholzibacteriota bacterium]|nr:CoB--CoM heterodisulfide reductase iron-sulfur subunit A family protein [Candidatus Krumholzibacteriota bacterium]
MGSKRNSVLIVGAGIAGIQAALDLAEMGVEVHLVEDTPTIGGRMPQLDKTFPTNDCSMCILSPKMSECARHPGIQIHILSNLKNVSGKPGRFKCTILERAKYVDPVKCVACGLCEDKCPVKIEDTFDVGLRTRKAISRYFLQSIPAEYTIDKDKCLYLTKGVCRICEKTCEAGAINYEDKDREVELEVGAIILAAGIDPFDPIGFGHFGYHRYPDVVTSLEFERMLSASGPMGGHVVRASNGKEPKKLAFIQCVGSRDEGIDRNYCSSACCMFAIKQSIIAKEHIKDLDSSIFYMDIRAFGKDFDKYYEKAEKQYGVKFKRSKVADIIETPEGKLRLRYTLEKGTTQYEEFDMVVLSIGLQAREANQRLSEDLDIRLNEFGFCRSERFSPLMTSREGVFVCGAMNGPKDIPESVVSASGAVANAVRFLDLERQGLPTADESIPEKNVIGQRPRIGVFVCHCGINIAGVVDVKDVAEYAGTLENVEHTEDVMYACSTDCLDTIKKRIEEHDLNRVVVAACTPRTHEPLFRETINEAGLNPYLFEMANIRDQCSWAHMDQPELATIKSKDLVEMGVAKSRGLQPLERLPIEIDPKALVIGGGLSGMTSALSLADAGHQVYLIEKEDELGGNLRNIFFNFDDKDPQVFLGDLIKKVSRHKMIEVLKGAEIEDISGYIGNYKTSLKAGSGKEGRLLDHGVVIVATGGEEHKTEEYLLGKSSRIVTQVEFERMLHEKDFPAGKLKNVVMIQCVGSREEGRMYCSRICCSKAVKNALELKKVKSKTNVYFAYRDIRTYGFSEKYYTELRDEGTVFLRYTPDSKPVVELIDEDVTDSRARVTVFDPIMDRDVVIDADLVVLATAIDAPEKNEELAKKLKVPLNADGMFLEAHVKLRPVDFATEGVFLCGLAHSPKDMDESQAQAKAAASRALTFLNRKAVLAEGTICQVMTDRCSGCSYCESICAYSAIEVDPEKLVAVVNEALCKGCGACVASCRCGALDLRGFTNQQMYSVFDSLDLVITEKVGD